MNATAKSGPGMARHASIIIHPYVASMIGAEIKVRAMIGRRNRRIILSMVFSWIISSICGIESVTSMTEGHRNG